MATVPGVDPDKVEITLDGAILTIKGEIPGPVENIDYLLQERGYGPISRSLQLGVPVQADKVEATFDKGVLTIVIPKAEEIRPKTIKVKAAK